MKGSKKTLHTYHIKGTPSFHNNALGDIEHMIHQSFPMLSVQTYKNGDNNITGMECTNAHKHLLAIHGKKQQQRYNVEFFHNEELLIPESIPDHLAQTIAQGQHLYECHEHQLHALLTWFAFLPIKDSIHASIHTMIE